jgi:hypothetical protein
MRVRKQSTATYHIPLYMVLSSDHITPATSKTVTVTLSKNSAGFGAASGAVTELTSGVYKLAANATDTDTLGSLVVLATASGCDPYLVEYTIVPFDPFDSVRLGMTALPNAAAEASGGLFTRGVGTGQINQDSAGRIDVNAKAWLGGTIPAVNVTGVPLVDLNYYKGTATPTADTAGYPKVTIKSGTGTGEVNLSSGVADANAVKVSGASQTARDLGASVLISSGTGTGQLDVTSGVIKANLAQILGTALTETAGQIAAAFKQFFNIASPTSTMNLITAVNDKTGYALTSGEHTNIASDTQTGLTNQGYTTARAGYLDTLNGLVQAIWDKATSSLTTAGSIGKLIVDYLDAAISSRLAAGSYTTPPTVTAIRQEMDTNSTKLANLDAAVSTRSTLTSANIWDALLTGITTAGSIGKLIKDYLDAAVTSRMATFTLPTNFSSLAIDSSGRTTIGDIVAAALAKFFSVNSGTTYAAAVSGSVVKEIATNASGGSADPWATDLVSGGYSGNEAGAIVQAIEAKTAGIVGASIQIVSPVVNNQQINIVRGDDYKNADGRALFANTTFGSAPSLAGATIALKVNNGLNPFSKTGVETGTATCYVELTSAETSAFTPKTYPFDLQATLANGDIVTLTQGQFTVAADVR